MYGHIWDISVVPCREVVPISEVNLHTKSPIGAFLFVHYLSDVVLISELMFFIGGSTVCQ